MKRLPRIVSVTIVDTIATLCLVTALLVSWIPGPGGIPLLILSLSLFSINHDWAKRYVGAVKKYAKNLGRFIFVDKPDVQLTYDIFTIAILLLAAYLYLLNNSLWEVSLATSLLFIGYTLALGNRNRWQRIKNLFKHKH